MTYAVSIDQLKKLAAPTPESEIKSRPTFRRNHQTGKSEKTDKWLSYIDARFVYDQLDSVCGPHAWQSDFRQIDGKLFGGIGILVVTELPDGSLGEQWVWKWDVGVESEIEAEKGNASDALKRAAVHWGIARDLYRDREQKPEKKTTRKARATTEDKPAGLTEPQRKKLMAELREAGLETSAQRKALTLVVTGKDSVRDMDSGDLDKILEVLGDPDSEAVETAKLVEEVS